MFWSTPLAAACVLCVAHLVRVRVRVRVRVSGGRMRAVRGPPVGHDPSFEAHLELEVAAEHVGVAAGVAAVDAVVAAPG